MFERFASRRQFLAGLTALGVGVALPRRALQAQTSPALRRLDLHHHFGSPRWKQRMLETKRLAWQQFQDWTPARSLDAMDKGGVTTAFLSCTEPGIWFTDDFLVERTDTIALAREMNDYGARLVSDYKGRFGLFAVLPLPDIDASLRAIEYAFDTLHADGVGLLTSYANHYIGEPMFDPILEELNRRGAVAFSHPTDGPCCHNLAGASAATMEWFTDTARAIMSVIMEGPGPADSRAPSPATRYPNIKFVWSHGGGSLIGVAHRVVGTASPDDFTKPPAPGSRLYNIRRFYYDTAGVTNPVMKAGLTTLLGGTSQMVFGSDYPLSNIPSLVDNLEKLGFTAQELQGIDRDNAGRILPKYKG